MPQREAQQASVAPMSCKECQRIAGCDASNVMYFSNAQNWNLIKCPRIYITRDRLAEKLSAIEKKADRGTGGTTAHVRSIFKCPLIHSDLNLKDLDHANLRYC
jgi:hypothetical protein